MPASGKIPIAESDFTEEIFPRVLPKAVQDAQRHSLSKISYRGDRWLFFRTMPETFTSLRFAHGSCRKWPGDTRRYERGLGKEDTGKYKCKTDGDDTGTDDNDLGPDMLDQFGHKWLAPQWNAQLKKYQAKNWSDWPRFFLHTGNQIYADDIGINTSKMLLRNRFAAVVPGPGNRPPLRLREAPGQVDLLFDTRSGKTEKANWFRRS